MPAGNMLTSPLPVTLKIDVLDELATLNRELVNGVVVDPWTARSADGVDEPMPTLPFDRMLKRDAPDDEATANGFVPANPVMANVAVGAVELTPMRLLSELMVRRPLSTLTFINVDVPVDDVALIVPNVPKLAARMLPVVRVVVAPELVK